jgi:hypothetical protein
MGDGVTLDTARRYIGLWLISIDGLIVRPGAVIICKRTGLVFRG